ncbi:hypothetical protein ISCGN_003402 [Ixodes scapularis]
MILDSHSANTRSVTTRQTRPGCPSDTSSPHTSQTRRLTIVPADARNNQPQNKETGKPPTDERRGVHDSKPPLVSDCRGEDGNDHKRSRAGPQRITTQHKSAHNASTTRDQASPKR